MQAIVLVGGEGTRLRPLTDDVPKPALTLVDRPFLAYMVEWLGRARGRRGGARLRLPARRAARGAAARASAPGSRLRYVVEPEPLRHRRRDPLRRRRSSASELDERFLALNGDVLTDLDLTALLRAHERARGAGDDRPAPGRGLRRLRPRRPRRRAARCSSSSRRPARRSPGEINAGTYVLERSVLDLIPPGRAGLDRARGLPAAGRRRPPRRCCSTATGWTSAPRSATCRRAGTSSRAGSRPRVEPTAPGMLRRRRRRRSTDERRRRPARGRLGPAAGSSAGAEVRDSVLLDGCAVGDGRAGQRLDPRRRASRSRPGAERSRRASSAEDERVRA